MIHTPLTQCLRCLAVVPCFQLWLLAGPAGVDRLCKIMSILMVLEASVILHECFESADTCGFICIFGKLCFQSDSCVAWRHRGWLTGCQLSLDTSKTAAALLSQRLFAFGYSKDDVTFHWTVYVLPLEFLAVSLLSVFLLLFLKILLQHFIFFVDIWFFIRNFLNIDALFEIVLVCRQSSESCFDWW